jgi:hypothetical protein
MRHAEKNRRDRAKLCGQWAAAPRCARPRVRAGRNGPVSPDRCIVADAPWRHAPSAVRDRAWRQAGTEGMTRQRRLPCALSESIVENAWA